MNLNELVDSAREASVDEILRLLANVLDILKKQRNKMNGGGLYYLPSKRNLIVIGDLHGDLQSLSFILKDSGFNNENDYLVFLGDYGDRGLNSAEVYCIILKLKKEFPDRVILLRGNHEFPSELPVYPHDLPVILIEKFGEDGKKIYVELYKLFDYFCNGAIVEGKYILLHGGLPTGTTSLKDIDFAHKNHPKKIYLEEILWSDPRDGIQGYYPSPRGAGRIFGPDVTERVLNLMEVKTLIRSHQPPAEGVMVNHGGKILTISSTKVYGGNAAYLKLGLSEKSKNAYELMKMVYVF